MKNKKAPIRGDGLGLAKSLYGDTNDDGSNLTTPPDKTKKSSNSNQRTISKGNGAAPKKSDAPWPDQRK